MAASLSVAEAGYLDCRVLMARAQGNRRCKKKERVLDDRTYININGVI